MLAASRSGNPAGPHDNRPAGTAWDSTVHAFQGRTVDNVIAVMEAKHPKLST